MRRRQIREEPQKGAFAMVDQNSERCLGRYTGRRFFGLSRQEHEARRVGRLIGDVALQHLEAVRACCLDRADCSDSLTTTVVGYRDRGRSARGVVPRFRDGILEFTQHAVALRQGHGMGPHAPDGLECRAGPHCQHVRDLADLLVDDRQIRVGQQRTDFFDAADNRVLDRQQRVVRVTTPDCVERLAERAHTSATDLAVVAGAHQPGRSDVAIGQRFPLVDDVDDGTRAALRLHAFLGAVAVVQHFAEHAFGEIARQTLRTGTIAPGLQQSAFAIGIDPRQLGGRTLEAADGTNARVAPGQEPHEFGIDGIDLLTQGMEGRTVVGVVHWIGRGDPDERGHDLPRPRPRSEGPGKVSVHFSADVRKTAETPRRGSP